MTPGVSTLNGHATSGMFRHNDIFDPFLDAWSVYPEWPCRARHASTQETYCATSDAGRVTLSNAWCRAPCSIERHFFHRGNCHSERECNRQILRAKARAKSLPAG